MVCFKCDRCGETYDFYGGMDGDKGCANAIATKLVYIDGESKSVENIHLCPDCMDSFDFWLMNPEEDVDFDEEAFEDDDCEDDEFDDWIEWARNSLVDHALTDIRKKKERKRNG